jgi:hypothetical protein
VSRSRDGGACRACAHFRNDAAGLERALPGLASLSSGDASVRGDDGLCLRHDRLVAARSSCGSFAPRLPTTVAVGG